MPTIRPREPAPVVVDAITAYLRSGDRHPAGGTSKDAFALVLLTGGDGDGLRQAWAPVRDREVWDWIRLHPGTRPWAWWAFDAPRWRREDMPAQIAQPGSYWIGTLAEPRRRLGGTGTPIHECLAYTPAFRFGLPVRFVDQWSVDYFTGRAVDVHGKRIGAEYAGRGFAGVAIDPKDPPRFESQAAYLERHGLLAPGEAARLTPADFAPETIDASAASGGHSCGS